VTGVSAARASMAIYSNDGNTRILTTAAPVNSGETQTYTVDIADVNLSPGFYWLAFCASDTGVLFRAVQMHADAITFNNVQTAQMGTAANAGSNGACPTTLGVISSGSFAIAMTKLQG
jgi:hypothetical protein